MRNPAQAAQAKYRLPASGHFENLVQIGMKYAKKLAKSIPIVWIGISNKAKTSPEISNIKMKAVKQSPDLPRPKQKWKNA